MLVFRATLLILVILLAMAFAWRLRAPRRSFFGRMLALLFLALIVEITGIVTAIWRVPNVLMYDLYATIEFVMLLGMVRLLRPAWRTVLTPVLVVGLLSMAYWVYRNGVTRYMAIEGLLTLGVLSCGVFLWLLVDLAQASAKPLGRSPSFWFFTGALLYFGGTIPILGAWRSMGTIDMQWSQLMYWIVVVLAIARYLLAAVACHLQHQQVRSTA